MKAADYIDSIKRERNALKSAIEAALSELSAGIKQDFEKDGYARADRLLAEEHLKTALAKLESGELRKP